MILSKHSSPKQGVCFVINIHSFVKLRKKKKNIYLVVNCD